MAPNHLVDLAFAVSVVGVVDLWPGFHHAMVPVENLLQAPHDVSDLAFGVEDETSAVSQIGAGSVHAEHVGELWDGYSEISGWFLAPVVIEELALAPADVHRPQETVVVKSGCVADHVDFVQLAIGCAHTGWLNALNASADEVDIVAG